MDMFITVVHNDKIKDFEMLFVCLRGLPVNLQRQENHKRSWGLPLWKHGITGKHDSRLLHTDENLLSKILRLLLGVFASTCHKTIKESK